MNCPYCRASNVPDEHRCQRCGRRLDASSAPSRPAYNRAAAAPALQYQAAVTPEEQEESGPDKHQAAFQPSLFNTRVVSFQSYAPESVEPRRRTQAAVTPRSRQKNKREIPGQESFHFDPVITHNHSAARSAPEQSILCDASVATPAHRTIAAAIDISIVIIALALFLLVFHFAGGEIVLNARTLPLGLAMAGMFFLLYELLWCTAGTDTAGMRWVRLKLINFDGQPPDREQRVLRLASSCLSFLAAGLGVIWALVDEESLAWHDHISKTFPTPF